MRPRPQISLNSLMRGSWDDDLGWLWYSCSIASWTILSIFFLVYSPLLCCYDDNLFIYLFYVLILWSIPFQIQNEQLWKWVYGWKYANIIFVFARVRRSTNILEYKIIFKRRVYLAVIIVSLRLISVVKVVL